MGSSFLSAALAGMVSRSHLRRLLARKIDAHIYAHPVEKESPDLPMVQGRCQYLSAMLHCINRKLDKSV